MKEPILYIHIISGIISLLTGAFAALKRKGSDGHSKFGRVFSVSLIISALSGLILSIIISSAFLLVVALFTIYLVCSGWTFARRMKLKQKKKWIRILSIYGIISGIAMVTTGLLAQRNALIILLAFSILIFSFSIRDLVKFPKNLIRAHGGRMGGAYIASATAFLVVNTHGYIPPLVAWLGPGLVGGVLISLGIRAYEKRVRR